MLFFPFVTGMYADSHMCFQLVNFFVHLIHEVLTPQLHFHQVFRVKIIEIIFCISNNNLCIFFINNELQTMTNERM